MTAKELIEELQKLPADTVVHVDHGEYADNWYPVNPATVQIRKCGTGYTRGLVEGVFLS
jgi:hypothetical protein